MERLHPRIRLRWGLAALALALVLAGGVFAAVRFGLEGEGALPAAATLLLAALAGGAHAVARYRAWRFELREDALFLERGVLVSVKTVVPYVRVQHVDARRGPLDRALGLASVVVYTAGSRGADVTIPGLTPERADRLQERLRDLAVESESEDAV